MGSGGKIAGTEGQRRTQSKLKAAGKAQHPVLSAPPGEGGLPATYRPKAAALSVRVYHGKVTYLRRRMRNVLYRAGRSAPLAALRAAAVAFSLLPRTRSIFPLGVWSRV